MKPLLTTLAILLPLFLVSQATAQSPSGVQGGEIVMEQDHKLSGTYEIQQNKGIEFLKAVQASASSGGSSAISTPDDSILSYLNVVYLYCSITEGTCPAVIDAVLEADIINNRSAGAAATCPITTSFWRLYIKSDMEQRHNHLVKTGFLGVTDDFKKKRRPAYIKCKDTVSQIVTGADRSERYKADSQVLNSIHKAVRIAEELKAKVPNLFTALGAR